MQPYAPYPLNLVRDWFHRRRWWVRLAMALVLVPWFGHFAYTRMTTRPAKPFSNWDLDPGLAIPDPAVDRTKELVAAITALPATPTLSQPTAAPAGMEWLSAEEIEARRRGGDYPYQRTPTVGALAFWMPCALQGDWTPATRYQLREIVRYLELPATQSALEQIIALSDKPSCITQSAAFGSPKGLSRTRELVWFLTARARYYMAEKQNFDNAVRHIEAVLNLAAGVEDDLTLTCAMAGAWCRATALSEIGNWGEEFPLTRVQTRRLQDLAASHHREAQLVTALAIRGERLLRERWIDEMYTDDGQGNGWLVLAHMQPATGTTSSRLVLNLFSPFFADRRRALGRTNDHLNRHATDVNWHAPLAPAKLDKGGMGLIWNPVLPCLTANEDSLSVGHRILFTKTLVYREGAVISLAVAAYHKAHGRYPPDLPSLVPDYLPAVPKDPFAGQSLRYKLDEKEGYRLYSVGANGVDDGGQMFGPDGRELDLPVQHKRWPARFEEWFLLPVSKPTSRGSND